MVPSIIDIHMRLPSPPHRITVWAVEGDNSWSGTETGRIGKGSTGMGQNASQGQVHL